MRTISLNSDIKQPVRVPFDDLVYPHDEQATFDGRSFAGRPLTESIQFRTCEQLSRGVPLHSLLYYQWTVEKLSRLGQRFAELLIDEAKGCRAEPLDPEQTASFTLTEQYPLLAESAATAFINLYDSIMEEWIPTLSANREITFFRKFGGKFTISEGRHRIAILTYKFSSREKVDGFKIDSSLIRTDYYRYRARGALRQFRRLVTG